jgi:hypothetical protein
VKLLGAVTPGSPGWAETFGHQLKVPIPDRNIYALCHPARRRHRLGARGSTLQIARSTIWRLFAAIHPCPSRPGPPSSLTA